MWPSGMTGGVVFRDDLGGVVIRDDLEGVAFKKVRPSGMT